MQVKFSQLIEEKLLAPSVQEALYSWFFDIPKSQNTFTTLIAMESLVIF